jgi:hypothetical protein
MHSQDQLLDLVDKHLLLREVYRAKDRQDQSDKMP